jgi:hypothetical protein
LCRAFGNESPHPRPLPTIRYANGGRGADRPSGWKAKTEIQRSTGRGEARSLPRRGTIRLSNSRCSFDCRPCDRISPLSSRASRRRRRDPGPITTNLSILRSLAKFESPVVMGPGTHDAFRVAWPGRRAWAKLRRPCCWRRGRHRSLCPLTRALSFPPQQSGERSAARRTIVPRLRKPALPPACAARRGARHLTQARPPRDAPPRRF